MNRPDLANLIKIYQELEELSNDEITLKFKEHSLKFFKENLVESVIRHIRPIGLNIEKYRGEVDIIGSVLSKGHTEAFDVAEKNLMEFKDAMNLLL